MKRILFIIPAHKIGGTCSSLRSIIDTLEHSEYEFSVYSLSRKNSMDLNFANAYYISSSYWADCLHSSVEHSSGLKKLAVLFLKSWGKVFKSQWLKKKILTSEASQLSKMGFDNIVAFEENSDVMRLVSYTTSSKKIIWIHCDYSRIYKKAYNSAFKHVDSIICVSAYTKKVFTELFPEYEDKTDFIYNILDEEKIKNMGAEKVDEFSPESLNIVSVGRLDPVKQFSMIPNVLAEVKAYTNKSVRWYIIGDYDVPGEKEKIASEISKNHLKDDIFFLGVKTNPYKYMKHADLVVSTSKSEACPYVINEAKIVGTPIVSNNFGSSYEFVDNYHTGIICPIESMASYINALIDNKENCYTDIKEYLTSYKYPNDSILEKIKSIL